MKILRILVLGALGCASAAGSAVVTSGFYDFYYGTGSLSSYPSFQLGLSDGYFLAGSNDRIANGFQCFFYPSPPGSCTISFTPSVLPLNDFDSLGTTVDQGVLYIASSPGVLAPTITSGTQTFVFPFAMSGAITTPGLQFPVCDLPTPDITYSSGFCSENVTGSGMESVTVAIYYNDIGGGVYITQDVRFDFTNSPEPSTLLTVLLPISFLAYRRYRIGCRS
jgi:hypothetical protein